MDARTDPMKLSTEPILLHPTHPFVTAKDRTEVSQSVLVRIEHNGVVGLGEAKVSADSCGGSGEDVCRLAQDAESLLGNDPFLIEDILRRLTAELPYACCTLAGIDIALHDLVAKLLGVPLYRLFGLNPERAPVTSYTLGIDETGVVLDKLAEAGDIPVLKIKVGFPGDVELVREIRRHSSARLRVDANGGWTEDEAVARTRELAELGVEFVEQPIRPGNPEALRRLRSLVSLPILADEDAQTAADVAALAGCVDGVNIKLMECGGLREAWRMIHVAKALGMRTMLGCMMESSLSLTAAAHLSPLVDYGDLDSELLIDNDPFVGFALDHGRIILPALPGIGVTPRTERPR
jgi:L-alanine-DL-glutamate epimerase-like enolase superfamily enzyme